MQSLWMLLACAMFALMGAFIKVSIEYDANLPQIIIYRGLPSVVFIYFWALKNKKSFRPKSWKSHFVRNLFGLSAMWLSFTALSVLPLSTATSLNYTAPLFIGGWMLFFGGGQRDPVRVTAVALGFLGVLAILRPSIHEDQLPYAAIGLLAGAMSAVAMMQIRQLGRSGEPEWRTVLFFSCGVCLTGLAGSSVWGWPLVDWQAHLALILVGVCGFVGQMAMTRAFGLGAALLTAVLQYSTIIFAAIIGIVLWQDIPDLIAWGGMALIIISGLISAWRTYSEDKIMRGESSKTVMKE